MQEMNLETKETINQKSTVKNKVYLILKAMLLVSPALILSLGELIRSRHYIMMNHWIVGLIPLFIAVPILLFFIIKETVKRKATKTLFLVVSSLYFVAGLTFILFYHVVTFSSGSFNALTFYIPLALIFMIAAAIFFTMESIKQMKKSKT